MGESATFRSEDRAGLAVAVVLHIAVVALLVFQPVREEIMSAPQRMTVNLASEVSLEATAPVPASESRAAIAPTLGEEVAPDVEEQPTETVPEATPDTPPPSNSRTATAPRSQPTSTPRQNTPTPRSTPTPRPTNAGGSRVGDDFLSGQGSSTDTDNTSAPAATFGRAERAALSSAITRQLRRHWSAPQGVDAERLVSDVSWRLNPNGSLSGRPRCRTRPGSITASNRPQAALHCERAIRAVQLAAPFNLPEQFYSRWKELEWEFNRRL
ncbi:MAG: energy transducer TonB [Erythrobacter sp.]|nr:energy transducer TonB [Erythrobacter sp.]